MSVITNKEPLVASRLNPYISFSDNARQAMEFYEQVFGGSLALNTFGAVSYTHLTLPTTPYV